MKLTVNNIDFDSVLPEDIIWSLSWDTTREEFLKAATVTVRELLNGNLRIPNLTDDHTPLVLLVGTHNGVKHQKVMVIDNRREKYDVAPTDNTIPLIDNPKKYEVEYPTIGARYKHYKGGLYTVKFLSNHSETNEVLVNYQSYLFGSYHSRPLGSWNEVVELDGFSTKRFLEC